MKSILQSDERCYLCGSMYGLERHHIMSGTANRKISERYGVWCWLCHNCHTGTEGAQYIQAKNRRLKELAQAQFEEIYGHQLWMELFRKNYL